MPEIAKSPKTNPKRRKMFIIIIAIIFGFAFGAAGYVAYKQYWAKDDEKSTPKSHISPSPKTTASSLDGSQTEIDLANRHPLAIVVENQTQARPQVPRHGMAFAGGSFLKPMHHRRPQDRPQVVLSLSPGL